jgi:uncharacterized protein YggT (Ycf19 family)
MATHIYRERVTDPQHSTTIYKERVTEDTPAVYTSRTSASSIVYYLLDVLEVVLGFRLLLKLLGANAANGFTNLIYNITEPLVAPFRGILPSTTPSGVVIEWASIIAMLVYALIAYAIVSLIRTAERA